MKRVRVLAVLLGILGMSFPLLSFAAPADGECKAGYCGAGGICPDGSACPLAPGQTCGLCIL
jgi:hypothetical protein